MPNLNSLELLENLREIRQWRKECFGAYESAAAYDLIIFLAIQFARGEAITIKQIFASIPHSYTAVRQHYKQLTKDELITHRLDGSDARIKYAEPTDKFLALVETYLSKVSSKFPPSRPF